MDRNRRLFLALSAATSALAVLPLPEVRAARGSGAVTLTPALTVGTQRRFTAVVEAEGTLKMNVDGRKVTTAPMKVMANLAFDEKVLSVDGAKAKQVIRYYTEGKANIKVDKNGFQNQLRDDFRTMCVSLSDESATMYSPLGPMTRDELELLKLAGEPIAWNALLPTSPVKPGDTWKLADTSLAILLGIEVVTASDVRAKLVSADAKVAMMELEGTVTGAIGGVAAEFDLKAKYNFDLAQKQLSWLALGIKEKRAIGHAEPGYEITSRVRISAEPLRNSPHLADSFLKQFPLELKEGSTLLTHDSADGAFQLLHDRRWNVMTDNNAAAILRLVDRGDLLAQCNISRLRDMPTDKELTLEAFQKEVTETLKATLQQIVDSDQSTTDNGLRQLRIVASGTVQEVPVQWIYYHLADQEGRNAALVYTMDARYVERFAELDRAMVGSLQLRSRSIDAATTTETASEENPQEAPQAAPAEQAAKPTSVKKK